MDGQNFIYTPLWVRVLALGALTVTLVFALIVTWVYIETEKESWVLVAMSVAQVAASGLVFALLVFFSARDVGALGLQVKTDAFLSRTLPRAFLFIDVPLAEKQDWSECRFGLRRIKRSARLSRTRVEIRHHPGSNTALYYIHASDQTLRIGVQANVSELTVSYYFAAASADDLERLREELDWAMRRYTEIGGYKSSWYFSEEAFDGKTYVSVHLTKDFGPNFLDDDRQKLQFAQDVAASTRSLVKECRIRAIALRH